MRSKPSACMCEVTSIKIIDDQLSILESKHLSIDHWCWSTKHWHSDIDIGNQPSRHRPSTEKLYHRGINHQHWSSTIKASTLTIKASTINIESWPSRYEQLTIDIASWPSIINDRHRTGNIQKHQFYLLCHSILWAFKVKKEISSKTSHVAIVMSDIHMIQQDIYILWQDIQLLYKK